ncbi:Lrp/AsnC family transcriptional regulator [Neorhizobium sp. Rsf11]|uniref:Lrp/AsnC family transcriptional regulator n=2 Tax=Neorhizobium TaxID=1525371 RepID=A0ABV0LZR6_9HYPH|nr:Lrp/AsnC family transcriptional regulator [Neorhizobium petrolearium]MCC2610744.1 Lrp/AsnC family transcriptional regulator [Neorhizobium petrolearium]WGI70869.1 Lrp/AsnC family transcriptional regulator [Neorhizobium petrolearium]
MPLTKMDREILKLMQQDATITLGELAHRTGQSASSAQRRLQKLREDKVILRDVSVVDPKKVGANVSMLVEVELERDRPELLPPFMRWLVETPEVQEAWVTSGRGDYTLVVLARSVEHFDELADRMMELNPNIRKFTTSVVLKTLKRTLAVHVE